MPERNRGYLRKQRLRNIERRKKLISQRELMYQRRMKNNEYNGNFALRHI